MPANSGITIRLDTATFSRQFRTLKRSQIEPLMVKAVSGAAFEVANAERLDVASSGFLFAPNTQQFLQAMRVIQADRYSTVIEAHVMPRGSTFAKIGGSERILRDHQFPKTISFRDPDDASRLGVEEGGELAIPAQVSRGGRGRVPARLRPSELIRRFQNQGATGSSFPFITLRGGKRGLLYRDEKQEGRLRLGFVLQKQAALKTGPLNFHGVARAVATLEFSKKVRRGFRRLRGVR